MNIKNIFQKNQIIIYTFALMLVAAGYLNYTNNIKEKEVETSVQEVVTEDSSNVEEGIAQNEENEATSNLVPNTSEDSTTTNAEATNETENTNTQTQENQKLAGVGDAMLVSSNDVVQDDYFVKSKLERDAMYSQMLETYENILNSSNTLEGQKETATQEIAKINETKNCIMICENLLKTKGFENCIIFVNGASISVIVDAKDLKQEETAQIQNIISRELGATIDNIHISIK